MARKYTCVVIDDDAISIELLETLIAKNDELELVDSFTDPVNALKGLKKSTPDIIYLDMHMPDMTGLELISSLSSSPKIIITTSQKEYALDAFEFGVSDYILKPINYSRFLKATEKAISEIGTQTPVAVPNESSEKIFLKVDSLLVSFDLKDFCFFEAYGDYVKVHFDNKMEVVYATMKSIESKLPSADFTRIHRSYVVRIDKIENIDSTNLQIGKHVLPISTGFRPKLMEQIKTL